MHLVVAILNYDMCHVFNDTCRIKTNGFTYESFELFDLNDDKEGIILVSVANEYTTVLCVAQLSKNTVIQCGISSAPSNFGGKN